MRTHGARKESIKLSTGIPQTHEENYATNVKEVRVRKDDDMKKTKHS